MKLSPRLQTIVDMVPAVKCVADIGSDHAYVPIYLVQHKLIQRAIASEVSPGPLSISQKDIQAANLQTQISTRLADGLAGLHAVDEVDLAVIAGMGGQLITQILKRGQEQLQYIPQLILEPNNDEACVRAWLSQQQWQIIDENIVQEGRHIYEIILAQQTSAAPALSSQEIMFGPCLLKKRDEVFILKWQEQLRRARFMYHNLQKAAKAQPQKILLAQKRIQQIEEVLA
ncbi:tRNA (adenine(22)-N(1))-methyltransferase [Bombilactobacillus bombi]|uniref:tRNA (adenine(22)-N(1))-methyltransferase n=1 Tax=Bombilactobacillus bombi TaxID=1303590 RepID=UPI0015E616EF|nr:tRNA (adenine(22)-N(1))-methyltransferase TrmK [Bombilactobacillus bombi]MBA1435061.1 hypothetical protein [Bombilactobacillus bombi]